jgi:hypothetical protein
VVSVVASNATLRPQQEGGYATHFPEECRRRCNFDISDRAWIVLVAPSGSAAVAGLIRLKARSFERPLLVHIQL